MVERVREDGVEGEIDIVEGVMPDGAMSPESMLPDAEEQAAQPPSEGQEEPLASTSIDPAGAPGPSPAQAGRPSPRLKPLAAKPAPLSDADTLVTEHTVEEQPPGPEAARAPTTPPDAGIHASLGHLAQEATRRTNVSDEDKVTPGDKDETPPDGSEHPSLPAGDRESEEKSKSDEPPEAAAGSGNSDNGGDKNAPTTSGDDSPEEDPDRIGPGQEQITDTQKEAFITAVRDLAPPVAPHIVPEEARPIIGQSILLSSSAQYDLTPDLSVVCSINDDVLNVEVETKRPFEKDIIEVSTDCYDVDEHGKPSFMNVTVYLNEETLIPIDYEANVKHVNYEAIRENLRLEERFGGRRFTQDHFRTVMSLLKQCGPHNIVEYPEDY